MGCLIREEVLLSKIHQQCPTTRCFQTFKLGAKDLKADILDCVYLGRWPADGIIGKSGAWPKIFGWKVRCLVENIRLGIRKSLENIWFEIRKILDISGIIKIGWWP